MNHPHRRELFNRTFCPITGKRQYTRRLAKQRLRLERERGHHNLTAYRCRINDQTCGFWHIGDGAMNTPNYKRPKNRPKRIPVREEEP